MAWIEVNEFSYTYPGEAVPALQAVNLSLERGAFAVLTGKSGSGKSTLGKALAGFLFADEDPQYSGEILVNGTDMAEIPLFQASERVAYVQQNPEDQFCTLTVQDEIAFGLENACLDPNEIGEMINQTLSVVNGLSLRDRDLSSLSGGEKQKIAIASMLALQPDVLILDEPTSNLDPIAAGGIFETLHNIRGIQNMTVLIIEHKLSPLFKFNPQIFSLDKGRIQLGWHNDDQESQPRISPAILGTSYPETTPPNPIIELSNLTVERGKKEILTDVNLSLSPGQFVALMGPNGSGKSTLLQTLMGFHHIKSGKCSLLNFDVSQARISDLVSDVGFIFQNPDHQLFEQSVWDEATLTTKNLGLLNDKMKNTAKEWLRLIGMGFRLNDHPQKLSYGEKRRLNLLSALLHGPKLLFVDEFLIGQDMINANLWMDFFKRLTEIGHTIILVIHHPELTLKFCDRLIFLEDGQILINERTETAFAILADMDYRAFLPDEEMESALSDA